MFNQKLSFLFIALVISTTVSCQINDLPKEFNITVNELSEAIVSDSNLVILDVRTPGELSGPLGKIEGIINIPVQDLEDRLVEIKNYKDKNIAVICRSGNRSVTATKILNSKGFTAKNVLGGMIAYNKL